MITITEQLKSEALALGFSKVGIAHANALGHSNPALTEWLAAGYQADMAWMQDPRRQDITQVLPGIESVVVVALNYKTPQKPSAIGTGKISTYTQGRDYHKVLGGRLKKLTRWLDSAVPDARHRWYVDTGPVTEKIWAQAAGLGWIGKNSLLLTREYGSLVFLGVLLTTVKLIADPATTAHCGTCQRCILACPTDAILPGSIIDSNRCLAYHTIENPALALPTELDLEAWVVGCDICQTCCPFNDKTPFSVIPDFLPRAGVIGVSLSAFARMSDEAFAAWSLGMALRRVKAGRLRRNARHRAGYPG